MSGLPFELLLALRYLRPKRTFVSVITVISVLGVALGVAVLIIVISVMSGFGKQMRDAVLGFNAHLMVYEKQSPLSDYHDVAQIIMSNRNVKAVTPVVLGQVLLETQSKANGSLTFAPTLRGIDPLTESNVTTLPSSIVEGEFNVGGRGLLIGAKLADNLEVKVGDRLSIYSPAELKRMKDTRNKPNQEVIAPDEYTVRGIFQVGYYEYDSTMVITSLANAQDMYELGDDVHDLMVMLHDPLKATEVQPQLERALGPRYKVLTWLDMNPILAAVIVEKKVMLYILFFIVLVAAFGITCTTITFVVMKTREIGVMKALGASSRQVLWVFLGQSLIVSVLGILSGLVFGLVAVHYRNEFLDFMRNITGAPLMSAEVYQLSQLPAQIIPGDIAIICGGSLLICLLAAAFPARYASKLNPVEALRYE
jgi:lipoprotein-releasing system permease protein